ncbi:hypothetical protein SCH01S_43_00040 [Sphingomonas changbaiensis NBRC 104936]|uniref:Uncharacterized protein n=1 Tax=Sphingomonas changbaiensis NBRC 104936 TaxID=1219043 RepID=A0A0E9MRJ5_9SPHN|nr:hypothetical protein [Sphingomonas changbaiensis]GAO40103.1 hypothetical protein SCH01S_43_00040 [Sphingomonas changbaiensis NBRC 104936]
MDLIWYLAATVAGSAFALWTKQKSLALGLLIMGAASVPAALAEFRTGDFWMGESLMWGLGLIVGIIVICVGELRAG